MLDELQNEIQQLKTRNARVDKDKAWEISRFRKGCIAILTYFMILLLMFMMGVDKSYLAALVPTSGFLLSTLSLQFAKSFWTNNFYEKTIQTKREQI